MSNNEEEHRKQLNMFWGYAVNQHIVVLLGKGGPGEDEKTKLADLEELLGRPDINDLWYGGPRCRDYALAVAKALAHLAFRPGGVEFNGIKYSVPPALLAWAQQQPVETET